MKVYEVREFGIDKLAIAEREIPQPQAGEVLVRMRAASLNFRDVMVVTGTYNPRMKMPAVPFSDGAGEIAAVGDGVNEWQIGDRVCPIFVQRWLDGGVTDKKRRTALGAGAQWDGVLREYAAFDARSVVQIPNGLSFEEASTLPCTAVTAWHALAVSGGLKAGESVLTLGTGGVSIAALQIAKLFGARVIATTSTEAKAAKLKALGADDVINYAEHEDWDAAVLDLTGKRGVDHVIEVGGGGTLARSLNSVRVGGHVALIGALSEGGAVDPIPIFMKAVRLQGIFVGSREMFCDVNRAVEEGGLRPVVDRLFEFNEVPKALEYMQSGAHFGKIVVQI
ncbi:MAG: zinc-dependent alcohol dehydrogenase family protein [Pyrinomonadaceae bacterium]